MGKALIIKNSDFSGNKVRTITFSNPVACTGITLDENTLTVKRGGVGTLTATPTPSDTTDAVTWTSSDTSVASVSNGVISGVSLGTATITATCGSYSATCAVTVALDYVFVTGYNPQRRSSSSSAATLEKQNIAISSYHVLAQDSSNTAIYPIESKDDIDTTPYRFVPIELPTGATTVVITSAYEMKTRMLWFNCTSKEIVNNMGAYCLSGKIGSAGWDQESWATTITLEVPDVSGINSFGGCVFTKNHEPNVFTNEPEAITIAFSYS